jgi:hypothetical protein
MQTKLKIIFALLFISTQTLAGNSSTTTLPLELSSQDLPFTTIQIEGHKIPLIFDTGASKSSLVLNNELIKKWHLKTIPTAKKSCFHDCTGKKICLKIDAIPEVKIGDFTLRNVPCQRMDELWGGHKEGFIWFEAARNGVIGLDLLRQFNVFIDYPRSQVTLMQLGQYPTQVDLKNWLQVPFKMTYGISTAAKINGTKVVLVWDTGANNSSIKSSVKIDAKKTSCADKDDPSCQYFKTNAFQVDNKKLTQTKFFIQQAQMPFDGFIGSSFFKEHIVFIDFKNNILFVHP